MSDQDNQSTGHPISKILVPLIIITAIVGGVGYQQGWFDKKKKKYLTDDKDKEEKEEEEEEGETEPEGSPDPSPTDGTCDEDDDCAEGKKCKNHKCALICDEDTPCPEGKKCHNGLCVRKCTETSDCKSGYKCDTDKGICKKKTTTKKKDKKKGMSTGMKAGIGIAVILAILMLMGSFTGVKGYKNRMASGEDNVGYLDIRENIYAGYAELKEAENILGRLLRSPEYLSKQAIELITLLRNLIAMAYAKLPGIPNSVRKRLGMKIKAVVTEGSKEIKNGNKSGMRKVSNQVNALGDNISRVFKRAKTVHVPSPFSLAGRGFSTRAPEP